MSINYYKFKDGSYGLVETTADHDQPLPQGAQVIGKAAYEQGLVKAAVAASAEQAKEDAARAVALDKALAKYPELKGLI